MKGVVFPFQSMDMHLEYLDQLCEIQKQDIRISCLRNGLEDIQLAITSIQMEISEKKTELRDGMSKWKSFILSKRAELNTVREKILKNSGLLGRHVSQLKTEKEDRSSVF